MIQSYFLYPNSPFHYKVKRATERHAYAMKETKLIPKETLFEEKNISINTGIHILITQYI